MSETDPYVPEVQNASQEWTQACRRILGLRIANGDRPSGASTANVVSDEQLPADVEGDSQQLEWRRRVNAIEPRVLDAQKNRAGEAQWLTMFMSAQDQGDQGEFGNALEILSQIDVMLKTPVQQSEGVEAALKEWTQARSTAIGGLRTLESAIRSMDDPEGDEAIILLKAIQANLSPRPDNLRAVNELEAYIRCDQIVQDAESPNGLGVQVILRNPLGAALGKLKTQLTESSA